MTSPQVDHASLTAADYLERIRETLEALRDGGIDAGREKLEPIAYQVRDIPKRPSIPPLVLARIYRRDGFTCRIAVGRSC